MNFYKQTTISVNVFEEGEEPEIFWTVVSGNKDKYISLLNGKRVENLLVLH